MREYGPGHPLVFSHIPKTAGTSLRAALEAALRPEVFVQGLDTSLFGGYDDYDSISPAMRASIWLSPEDIPADATLVAGHISPWTTLTRFPGADHITILRVPQVRAISQFLHSRSLTEFDLRHWGVAAQAFRVGWLPLRQLLDEPMVAPNVDNTITRFLAWPHPALSKTEHIPEARDEELFDAAMARLDQLGYVDVAENPEFMSGLGAWLGRDLSGTRLNERTSVPPRMRPDLDAELSGGVRERLDHLSRIDVRLWSHVVRRVLPTVDPDRFLEDSLRSAVQRYTAMLQQPDQTSTKRRVVERLYEVGVRLDPRRRPARGGRR